MNQSRPIGSGTAPYEVMRAGAPSGLGYGRGWVAIHRASQLGVHRSEWVQALAWTKSHADQGRPLGSSLETTR